MTTENENTEGKAPDEHAEGVPEREVDPASNPGPRGNQEADPERTSRGEEDLERAGAN